jgi:hypothetical protein
VRNWVQILPSGRNETCIKLEVRGSLRPVLGKLASLTVGIDGWKLCQFGTPDPPWSNKDSSLDSDVIVVPGQSVPVSPTVGARKRRSDSNTGGWSRYPDAEPEATA